MTITAHSARLARIAAIRMGSRGVECRPPRESEWSDEIAESLSKKAMFVFSRFQTLLEAVPVGFCPRLGGASLTNP